MFSYFTVKSANKILPEVIKKFQYVTNCKAEVIKAEQQLQKNLSVNSTFEEQIILKQNLNSRITKFYQSIDDLESMGVVLKGIEEGLLDFPAKRFNEEIWLCWKKGEKEIKFWHEKDSGFMGRKPIEVADESLV